MKKVFTLALTVLSLNAFADDSAQSKPVPPPVGTQTEETQQGGSQAQSDATETPGYSEEDDSNE